MPLHLGLGDSLKPFLPSESLVEVEDVEIEKIGPGDLVLYTAMRRTICHRVIKVKEEDGLKWFFLKGDHNLGSDGWIPSYRITGRVSCVNGESLALHSWQKKTHAALLRSRLQAYLYEAVFHSALGQALGEIRRRWFSTAIFSPVFFSVLHALTPEEAK